MIVSFIEDEYNTPQHWKAAMEGFAIRLQWLCMISIFTSVISYKSNGIESLVDLMSNFYSGEEASVVDDIVAAIQYQIVNTRQVVDK